MLHFKNKDVLFFEKYTFRVPSFIYTAFKIK